MLFFCVCSWFKNKIVMKANLFSRYLVGVFVGLLLFVSCNEEHELNNQKTFESSLIQPADIGELHNLVLVDLYSSTDFRTKSGSELNLDFLFEQLCKYTRENLKKKGFLCEFNQVDYDNSVKLLSEFYQVYHSSSDKDAILFLMENLSNSNLYSNKNAMSEETKDLIIECMDTNFDDIDGVIKNLEIILGSKTKAIEDDSRFVIEVFIQTAKASNQYWNAIPTKSAGTAAIAADGAGAAIGMLAGGFLSVFVATAASIMVNEAEGGSRYVPNSPLR